MVKRWKGGRGPASERRDGEIPDMWVGCGPLEIEEIGCSPAGSKGMEAEKQGSFWGILGKRGRGVMCDTFESSAVGTQLIQVTVGCAQKVGGKARWSLSSIPTPPLWQSFAKTTRGGCPGSGWPSSRSHRGAALPTLSKAVTWDLLGKTF